MPFFAPPDLDNPEILPPLPGAAILFGLSPTYSTVGIVFLFFFSFFSYGHSLSGLVLGRRARNPVVGTCMYSYIP